MVSSSGHEGMYNQLSVNFDMYRILDYLEERELGKKRRVSVIEHGR
jgi:hypothetical protein